MQTGPHIMILATKNFQLLVYDLSLAFSLWCVINPCRMA